MDGNRAKREAILEGRQIVRIPAKAVSGVALALGSRKQREAHLESRWGGPEVQGDL